MREAVARAQLISAAVTIACLCMAVHAQATPRPRTAHAHAGAGDPFRLWSSQRAPSPGPARVYGATSGGCVAGAAELPAAGAGYWTVRPGRASHFGHPDLIDYIQRLGERVQAHMMPPLPIGDLSLPRGGPYPNQHRSHQTGLDVDIYYRRLDGVTVRPPLHPSLWAARAAVTREPPWRPADLHPERIEALRLASQDERVDRIFVNPKIKAALCRRVRGDRGWLARLQPFWGHERHFHVRLRCPRGSPDCVARPLPGPSSEDEGCAEALTWWFSPAARTGYTSFKNEALATQGRNLPAPCATLADETLAATPSKRRQRRDR